ncbi:MAG: hypothetical protein KJN71_02225 [Acidimicrobiia bacterium]|nr:hypothetical protein [Acidimicrobiia bacterium]
MDERTSQPARHRLVTKGAASRSLAAELVGRIVRDGAYSNVVLRSATSKLSPPDRALVYADVYAVLRRRDAIDELIAGVSGRSVADIDPDLLDRLRVGVVELKVHNTPPHAAVDSIVGGVDNRGRRGFVNAVLRKLVGAAELPPPRLPDWIRSVLETDWGTVDAFEAASLADAPLAVRLRPGAPEVGNAVEGIAPARIIEDAATAGDLVRKGEATIADPASTAVGMAVEAAPGERILDMAAAPGGKTIHLRDAMEGTGLLVAADVHHRRLVSAARRVEDPWISWLLVDGTRPAFKPGSFDRVLLDAPCTGLGTLRRRPEIMHRIEPRSIDDLAKLQSRLLDAAIDLVRPGGRVVYSVCTVTAAETTGVVGPRGGRAPAGLPGADLGSGLMLRPDTTGTDGMFISVIDR